MNRKDEKLVLFVMGPTCSGKSSVIQELMKLTNVRAIQVGKELRRRYGADYFKGNGAPDHTEPEAWSIFTRSLDHHLNDPECSVVVVDGQPRRPDVVNKLLHHLKLERLTHPMLHWRFAYLHAAQSVRIGRAMERDEGDEEALELAKQRVRNDLGDLCEVLVQLVLGEEAPAVLHSIGSVKFVVDQLKRSHPLLGGMEAGELSMSTGERHKLIAEAVRSGRSVHEAAEDFNVTERTVYRVCKKFNINPKSGTRTDFNDRTLRMIYRLGRGEDLRDVARDERLNKKEREHLERTFVRVMGTWTNKESAT